MRAPPLRGSTRTTDPWHLVTTLALLFAGVIPWRPGVYFEGSFDPVVIAKAALIMVAFLLAALPRRSVGVVPAGPVVLLVAYLSATTVGALLAGTLAATAVVVVRMLLVAAALLLLVAAYGADPVAEGLFRIFLGVVVLATVTGGGSLASGRLRGGLPPLHPNELALLASLCLVWIAAKFLQARDGPADYAAAIAVFGVVYLTGSRTTLLALLVALALMVRWLSRISLSGVVAALCALPALGYALASTNLVASITTRGGDGNLSTLSNRTIAWEAATRAVQGWEDLIFGRGLSVKRIEVPGQLWNVQILDSSWVSALLQAGTLGLVVVASWLLAVLWRSVRQPSPLAALWLGWLALLSLRSVLESGLFDASVAFMVLWVTSLGCWWRPDSPESVRDFNAKVAQGERSVRA